MEVGQERTWWIFFCWGVVEVLAGAEGGWVVGS